MSKKHYDLRYFALGDIHANRDFIDNIYQAFGRIIGEQDVKHAADSYAKIYEAATVLPTVAGLLENEFLDAWEAEYGASLDGMRAFLDELEDLCGKPPGVLIEVPRSLLNSTLPMQPASPLRRLARCGGHAYVGAATSLEDSCRTVFEQRADHLLHSLG